MNDQPETAKECADRLKALSEPHRYRIVDLLRGGPLSVSELSSRLDVELVTTSHHLQVLKNAGLVSSERQGRNIVYRLNDAIFRGETPGASCDILDFGCCRLEMPREGIKLGGNEATSTSNRSMGDGSPE